ncbi:unnamed protein product [Parnassius apollo]|uniref:(apollo) hypothetical protein n=1 Tax=Parnassius apollo TaxID=110799 RepID=A0A8S3XL99_PARAO|nr:unnamed protein product [Parnassius apollo]
MKYVSVVSRTTKKKVLYQNEGYFITAKNSTVFKDEFMFLSMEEGWKPDVYFVIVLRELELSEINDVFKFLLRYHVFKVLVINRASNANVYTYNPFENYGCGKVFTRTISYGKCMKANITKSFFYKPVTGLRKCTFKVGFCDLPPYAIDPNNNKRKEKIKGIEQFVLETLSELEQFNVIYSYQSNPEETSAIGDDMIASGPLSSIQKGDVEIMLGGYSLMHKRAEAFSYLYGHHSNYDGLIILVKKAGLRKCTFEVGFNHFPPYVIDPNNDQSKEKLMGLEQYILQTLSELEQFKVIYTHKYNSDEISDIGDDMIASGSLSSIQKGDVKILVGGFFFDA